MKRATLRCVRLFFGRLFVDAEPVFGHHLVGFLRIDVGIHLERLVVVLAARRRGHALVLGDVRLINLTVTVGFYVVHSGLVPGSSATKSSLRKARPPPPTAAFMKRLMPVVLAAALIGSSAAGVAQNAAGDAFSPEVPTATPYATQADPMTLVLDARNAGRGLMYSHMSIPVR